MKPILCVDIDRTIYDLNPVLSETAEEIVGEPLNGEDFTDWMWLQRKYGEDVGNSIYKAALVPEKVSHRTLTLGASRS